MPGVDALVRDTLQRMRERGIDAALDIRAAAEAEPSSAIVRLELDWCGALVRWYFVFSGFGPAGPAAGLAAPDVLLSEPPSRLGAEQPAYGGRFGTKPAVPGITGSSSVLGAGLGGKALPRGWFGNRGSSPGVPFSSVSAISAGEASLNEMVQVPVWSLASISSWDGADEGALTFVVDELLARLREVQCELAGRTLPTAASQVSLLDGSAGVQVLTSAMGDGGSKVVVRLPLAGAQAGNAAAGPPAVVDGQALQLQVTFRAEGATAAARGGGGIGITARVVAPRCMGVTAAVAAPPWGEAGPDLVSYAVAVSSVVTSRWSLRRSFLVALADLMRPCGAEGGGTGSGALSLDTTDFGSAAFAVRAHLVEGKPAPKPLGPMVSLVGWAGPAGDDGADDTAADDAEAPGGGTAGEGAGSEPAAAAEEPAVSPPAAAAPSPAAEAAPSPAAAAAAPSPAAAAAAPSPAAAAAAPTPAAAAAAPSPAAAAAASSPAAEGRRIAAVLRVVVPATFPVDGPALTLRSVTPSPTTGAPVVLALSSGEVPWSSAWPGADGAARTVQFAWMTMLPRVAAELFA